jgi:nucleoside-diphosphate-sugar epimerase
LVKSIFLLLDKGITRMAYFVSDGNVYTNAEYANIVKEALGKKRVFKIYIPVFKLKIICFILDTVCGWFGKSPTLNRDKYNILKARNWNCDIEPLQKDTNFHADYDLTRGISEIIELNLTKNRQTD